METLIKSTFNINYKKHLQHLKLKGYQPKTIDAYSRAIRRIGSYFDHDINDLSEEQLTDYFAELHDRYSWSTVKLDLHGLVFYYRYVIKKPWEHIDLIRSPKVTRLPDTLTREEAARLFSTTQILSYRVLFFTLYSMGLRIGEGLNLKVGDIDAARHRVHIRDAKGNKDRFVPLPDITLGVLRRFWSMHRHPLFLFPNRKEGLKGSQMASTPLNQGGAQPAMRQVIKDSGIKKR